MNIDITTFKLLNVVDSCSIWNIVLSPKIYHASIEAKCYYSLTHFVEYECLHKVGKEPRDESKIKALKEEFDKNKFMRCSLSIDDLQEIDLLNNRKSLGKGELSSIALAKKTRQAFMTDDKRARSFGLQILGKSETQTTPHLVGYLFYNRYLTDGDFPIILKQHQSSLCKSWGDLTRFFQEVYDEAMRLRLLTSK